MPTNADTRGLRRRLTQIQKPRFALIAAVSLDGRITRGSKEGSEWTSSEDRRWFHKEFDRYDAVIMGRRTFDAIPRPLTPRNRIIFTRSPLFCCSQEQQNKGCAIAFSGNAGQLHALLKSRGWEHIAVLGGTQIYNWFLKRNLISEMYLTLEPVIFGSGKPFSARALKPFTKFYLVSIQTLNPQGTLLLHYKIRKTAFSKYLRP